MATISPDDFAREVARLQRRETAGAGTATDGALAPQSIACQAPGRGRVVEVRYDGSPALLVYRPVHGDSQVVDLIVCGSPGIRRSVTLPAR